MEEERGFVLEWKIKNFSQWCAEVHGNSITSPKVDNSYCDNMELYPRGESGQAEHLLVHFSGIKWDFTGDLSFIGSNESFLYTQQVIAEKKKTVLELPPGPSFQELRAKIFMNEDQITVRCRIKNTIYRFMIVQLMSTTIDVMKISLKLNIKWILNLNQNIDNRIAYMPFSPCEENETLNLLTQFNQKKIQFMIEPRSEIISTTSVDTCMSLLNSDNTIDSHEKKNYIFSDKTRWTFSDSMVIKELLESRKTILLSLKIKSKDMIKNHIGVTYIYNGISMVSYENVNFSEEKSLISLEPVACTQAEDSVTVLTKDFSCLFQDQDFSDLQLKCGGVSFPAHRNILSARSPVFKRLLSSDMKEAASGEVDIGDIDPPTLARFLAFLYSGTVEDLQGQSALKLYYAADKYQVLSLKRDCSDFLLANVSVSNVCDILAFADRHQDEDLGTVSKNFILDNFSEVLKSKEWDTLVKSEPSLVANTVTHFAVNDRLRKHDP